MTDQQPPQNLPPYSAQGPQDAPQYPPRAQDHPQYPPQQPYYPQQPPQQPVFYTQPGPAAYAPVYAYAPARNGFATAALTLGICGFVLMGIPLFIGWFLGGPTDILAVIFGIIAINRSSQLNGAGRAAAVWGLCLGAISLLSVFIGAGTLW